jgi:hypothetical protein
MLFSDDDLLSSDLEFERQHIIQYFSLGLLPLVKVVTSSIE